MRTGDKEHNTQQRLTPEDIQAIRRGFLDADGQMPDVRAHGAITITDLAEAFGVPPDEVLRVLDRYREERALAMAPSRGMDQKGLLALAGILFVTAFGIYRFGPRRLSPEEQAAAMERQMEEIKERRKRNPVIHYPIKTKVESGALPPYGFNVTFRGRLTVTEATGTEGPPKGRQATTEALTNALMNAYEVARKAETSAPEPTKPLPKRQSFGWGAQDIPGTLGFGFGGENGQMMGYVNLDPNAPEQPNATTPTGAVPTRQYFRQMAEGLVEGMISSQELTLKPQPITMPYVTPPAGFSITLKGRVTYSTSSMRLTVAPMDPERVEKKLEATVRGMILNDRHGLGSPADFARGKKAGPPPFLELRIDGPLKAVEIKVPQMASAQYPTAADALRAGDRILREGIHKAAQQVATLNKNAGEAR